MMKKAKALTPYRMPIFLWSIVVNHDANPVTARGRRAEPYNQGHTMRGTRMVFLVVMPIGAAFANYLMPLQIGARDVAFPRINALSFWTFLAGGLLLNTSWLAGGGPDGGWFMYAPNSSVPF